MFWVQKLSSQIYCSLSLSVHLCFSPWVLEPTPTSKSMSHALVRPSAGTPALYNVLWTLGSTLNSPAQLLRHGRLQHSHNFFFFFLIFYLVSLLISALLLLLLRPTWIRNAPEAYLVFPWHEISIMETQPKLPLAERATDPVEACWGRVLCRRHGTLDVPRSGRSSPVVCAVGLWAHSM